MKNKANFLFSALVAAFSLSAAACPYQEATMQHSAALWLFFVPVTFMLCVICTLECASALRAAIAYASRFAAIQADIQAAMEADAEPDGHEQIKAYKEALLNRGDIIELETT